MRPRVFLGITAAVLLRSSSECQAHRSGSPDFRNGSPSSSGLTCTACHAPPGGTGTGSVQILNAPAAYNFNRVYNITVPVAAPAQAGAGFELSVENAAGTHLGTLILSDATNTRFADNNPEWVTHSSSGVTNSISNWSAQGNSATFNLRWRAPATNVGAVTFYAAGNAINNSMNSAGDRVYTTNVSATPVTCAVGDMDQDGFKNGADIAGFVESLLAPSTASDAQFCAADINVDGNVDLNDVQLFVGLLVAP